MGERLQRLIDEARRDVLVLYLAARDPRVPRGAKFLAIAAAAYALSPIDLIPDFIPILGLLDDLILIPLAFWIVTQAIDDEVLDDLRVRAAARIEPISKSAVGAVIVICVWLLVAGAIWLAVVELHE